MSAIRIRGVGNSGAAGGRDHPHPGLKVAGYNGNASRGIAMSACRFVTGDSLHISEIESTSGRAAGIDLVGPVGGCAFAKLECSQIVGATASYPMVSGSFLGSEQMEFNVDCNVPCIRLTSGGGAA